MKNKLTILAAGVAMLLSTAASAHMSTNQDVAIDKHAQPIGDKRGNCVYTKWDAGQDVCGPVEVDRLKLSRAERTVYFDFNKSGLRSSEVAKLDSLIRAIRSAEGIVTSVDIVGFADRIGNTGYNQRLSQRRAETVRDYLLRNGNVRTRKIDMQARGESESVTNCGNLPRNELIACLQEDRRVEIQLNYAN